MPRLPDGAPYKNRPPGMTILSCSIDREAKAILVQLAAHQKGFGDVVSRLLHQEQTRVEERAKLRRLLETEE